ncbi:MAG TPA: EcsC family protein [Usitatibacter sp.]|nr:EcsC family protein [Usitatibacter sp.]
MPTLDKQDLADLARAKALLENPGLAVKFSSVLGSPVEAGMKMLPKKWQKTIHAATEAALMKALDVAVRTLGARRPLASSDRLHKVAAATSGAMGGAFGIAALGIELPISTTLILRSIADIAAAEGEDPRHLETKLACLTVFALGSTRDKSDDAAESAYFAARSALATAVTEASKYLAEKGLSKSGAPALVRLVALIASRFGVVVTQKTAAQMIPVIGAAGGAVINTLFIGHYQDMARGHFIVRRLEKIHGAEPVRLAYEAI